MEHRFVLNKRFIVNIIVAIFFLFIIYGFIKLISPFVISIFLAIIFSVIYYPIYDFLISRKINKNIASVMTLLLMLFTFVLPLIIFGWLLFKEARVIYPEMAEYINNISNFKLNIHGFIPISNIDLKEIIVSNFENIHKAIMKTGLSIIKNIFMFFVNFFVMIILMFFSFKDGKYLLKWIIEIIPFDSGYIERILSRFSQTTNAIMRGVLLTAFIQGIVASIGYYIAGLSSPVLLGFFVIFSALIPFVGTATITIPITIYVYFNYDLTMTIFVLIWGVFVVGLIDNIIRPLLIGKDAQLPISLVFLGLVAGIKSYGPVGLFLGPIFVSIIITILKIYKENIQSKNA
ncbi:MAG: AI-2E family transporter [Elusimicrobiota bacterium]